MQSNRSRRRFLRQTLAASATMFGAGITIDPIKGQSTDKPTDKPGEDRANRKPDDELPITGLDQPQLASFDRLMRDFVRQHQAVGAALAVTKDGRLVYARGFGVADRDGDVPVEPASLFRIASISKPVTAVAILQLVAEKRLELDAKICRVLEITRTKDERWQTITIQQLLNHTGGWDRAKSFDPMFRSVEIAKDQGVAPPAMPEQIIRYMAERPLDFDPGSRYAYSNFGYSLLGRAIERTGRASYGEYVRRKVLTPLGIRGMRLGATLPAARAAQEVCYYDRGDRTGPAVMGQVGQQVPLPYGAWCLEAMDSHGGWIASAVDLVRFAAAFDVPDRCRLLQPASIETMFAPPTGAAGHNPDGELKQVYYACGWNVRPVGRGGQNTWHTGSLDGTSTILVRRYDGLNWAVLFNCREDADGKTLSAEIDSLVHGAADEVQDWPAGDQFRKWL